MELFGVSLPVTDFPRVKSLRGIGLSDSPEYADRLVERFDYRNTSQAREPRLDIANPPPEELGKYDFLLASEVFKHVMPPVEVAFQNAFRLLKPSGVLVLTVPYSTDPATAEHFTGIHQFGLAQVGDRVLLVNRSASGEVQVFDNLIFHFGGGGPSLEVREFSETGLKDALMAAGFSSVDIYSENYAPFGIVRAESWSLPVVARKGPFAFRGEAVRDVLAQWGALRKNFRELGGEFWVRLGFKLGLVDRDKYFMPRESRLEPKGTDL